MKKIIGLLISFGLLVGCTNPGIIKISPDTYLLAREAHGGVFASTTALKASVIQDANTFAENQGKVAIPISAKEKPMGNGPAQWASFEYQFRVVEKNDPAVTRTQLVHNPNIVIQKRDPDAPDARSNDKADQTKDVYSELIKFEDLHQRGILTDKEFQVQKDRILKGK